MDGDGICDDVDDCRSFDECGICNGPELFMIVSAMTSQKEIATVMATSYALFICGGNCEADVDLATESAMTWMTVLGLTTSVVYVTDLSFTSDVRYSRGRL